MPRETFYVLDDGSAVDPNDVAPDESGALMHKSGVAVAVGPHGPRSRSVDLDDVVDGRLVAEGDPKPKKEAKPAADRQMKPKAGGKYETR